MTNNKLETSTTLVNEKIRLPEIYKLPQILEIPGIWF